MEDIKLEKQLPVIKINFEEVKASLIEGASKYKGIIVTESTLKDCKIVQKQLSKTKSDLDTYRKTIKREMLKPVTIFEDQCKTLISLVAEVETPIKAAILIFDNEARAKKKLVAQIHIDKAIIDFQLDSKYGSRLIVLEEYSNVSVTVKKVIEDIEMKALLLQHEQQQEAEKLQIIKDTIENCNKDIDAKMSIEDFKMYMDEPTPIILNSITSRAERIKVNELKAVEDRKAKAEKEVLERIVKAEMAAVAQEQLIAKTARVNLELKEAIEREKKLNLENEKKAAEDAENLRLQTIEDNIVAELNKKLQAEEDKKREDEETIKVPVENVAEKQYFIEFRIECNAEKVTALSHFLKDNDYTYGVSNKGWLNE